MVYILLQIKYLNSYAYIINIAKNKLTNRLSPSVESKSTHEPFHSKQGVYNFIQTEFILLVNWLFLI